MKLDDVPVCFHFYVCEVPYPVISVARFSFARLQSKHGIT